MTPKILFIGPDSGGGMTAVIRSCCAMFPDSRVVWSYHGGSGLHKVVDVVKGLREMRRVLRAHPEIGIVHIHTASNASFWRKMCFARLAKRMGRKVVMHVHGGGFREFYATAPSIITRALNSMDYIVVLSQLWEEFLDLNDVTGPISIIPNPVPEPTPMPVEPDGKIHFLYLGLLAPVKGILELMDTIAANADRWKGRYVFHIGGVGPEQESITDFIRRHGLEELVVMEGWVDGQKKARLLSQCDALLQPSRIEAMPISILEAMSYGKPVVATPVGSVPTVVTDGENGLLIPVGDLEALARAIDTLAADPSLRQRMGRQGLEMVKPYNQESVAQKLQKLYERL